MSVPDPLVLALRFAVGAVLVIAGWRKARAGRSHVLSLVLGYRLLPIGFARVAAAALPVLELLLGILIFAGLITSPAALATLLLIALFTLATVSLPLRGLRVPCGCFGGDSSSPTKAGRVLARNVLLLLGAGAILLLPRSSLGLDGLFGTGAIPWAWIAALGIALAVAILIRLLVWHPGATPYGPSNY